MKIGGRFDPYPEMAFGGFSRVDGTVAFYLRVNALLTPNSQVLDIGCGRGAFAREPHSYRRNLRTLRGKCERVVGIDVDAEAAQHPLLDEFRRITGERWPIDDQSIDVGVADFVLEHVSDPQAFFAEIARVLRPGGYICIRTSNVLGYVGLASRIIPGRWHAAVIRAVQESRDDADVFPTSYRCNTIGKLRRNLSSFGFEHCVFGVEAEPAYFAFSRTAYVMAAWCHRLVPGPFRSTLFAFGRRAGD